MDRLRIAILNWSDRRVGGVEVYLDRLLPELVRRGHSLILCVERPVEGAAEPIRVPAGTEALTISELGQERVLDRLRAWQPDIVFRHIFGATDFERRVLDIAPTIFFAHAYYGTCISGLKMFRVPIPHPCDRQFGPACLALYLPRRCGGLSPVTMVRRYQMQAKQRDLLPKYDAIVTHSEHMRTEYVRHGAHPDRVHAIPFFVATETGDASEGDRSADGGPLRLLFLGRMDYAKGGHVLVEALPRVARALDRAVVATFAGDGPERRSLERAAKEAVDRDKRVSVDFLGWVRREGIDDLFGATDLLVVPSLWPEPFGQVGLEAGLRSVPSVAFDVGGISAWLRDGVNGKLVERGTLSASGLAGAVVECARDPEQLSRLARGAREVAGEFAIDRHVSALIDVFERYRRSDLSTSA